MSRHQGPQVSFQKASSAPLFGLGGLYSKMGLRAHLRATAGTLTTGAILICGYDAYAQRAPAADALVLTQSLPDVICDETDMLAVALLMRDRSVWGKRRLALEGGGGGNLSLFGVTISPASHFGPPPTALPPLFARQTSPPNRCPNRR